MKDISIQLSEMMVKFLPVHTVLALVLSFIGNQMLIQSGVILFLIMIFYLILRNKIKNGILFIFLHIISIATLLLFLNGIAGKAVAAACVFFAADSILIRQKNKETKSISSLTVLFFMLCFFIGSYFGKKAFLPICTAEAVMFVGCTFLFDGLMGTREFLAINENVTDIPTETIKKKTGIFLIFFTMLSVFAMIMGINSGLGEICENIGKSIIDLFGNLFKRDHEIQPSQLDYSVRPDIPLPDMSVYNIKKGREIPMILKSIGRILFQSLLLVGSVFVLRMLIIKMKNFLSGLYDTKSENEKSEFALPDKEKFVIFKNKGNVFAKFKDSKPNDAKIRRAYKKYIRKNIKKELGENLTPEEISKNLELYECEYDGKIRKIYEKARYSAEECSDEEVVEIKNLVKRNGKKS